MIIPSNISRRKDPKNLLLYFYSHDSAVAADFAAIPSPLQEHLELRTPSLCLSLQPLHTHTHSLSRNNFKKLRRFRDKCSWWAFGALCINQTFWFILFLFSLIAILFFKHLRSQRSSASRLPYTNHRFLTWVHLDLLSKKGPTRFQNQQLQVAHLVLADCTSHT